MTNVINFPTQSKQSWDVVVKFFKEDVMANAGASPEKIEEFLVHFRPIFESFQFEYNLQFKTSDQSTALHFQSELEAFNKAFHEHTNKLLMDRMLLEVNLFDW